MIAYMISGMLGTDSELRADVCQGCLECSILLATVIFTANINGTADTLHAGCYSYLLNPASSFKFFRKTIKATIFHPHSTSHQA
jgi:hypothetical protein